MKAKLFKKAANSDRLPAVPAVAANILRLLNDPMATPEELLKAFQHDEAICKGLLAAANSSLYGNPKRVNSPRDAVSHLGLRSTMSLVLALAIAGTMKIECPGPLDREYFWKRAVIAAASSLVMLEKEEPHTRESVFIAALLQDIGVIVLALVLGKGYSLRIEEVQYNHRALSIVEQERIGMPHSEMGAWLLEEWRLPEAVVRGVRHSHDDDGRRDTRQAHIAFSGLMADYYMATDTRQSRVVIETEIIRALSEFTPGYFDNLLQKNYATLTKVAAWFDNCNLAKTCSTDLI